MLIRGGSRTAATSKMELFVLIFNGFQPLAIITKCSILDVAVVLDLPLINVTTTTNPVVIANILLIIVLVQAISKIRSSLNIPKHFLQISAETDMIYNF